jgi:class 3 adenylate cyclase
MPVASQPWTVMFVDIEDSTRLKYREDTDRVTRVVLKLFDTVRAECHTKESIKFTGDGAMVVFNRTAASPREAIAAAERIVQRNDTNNLQADLPLIHIRIGIATGPGVEVQGVSSTDVVGKHVDLAARLCGDAERDGILIDDTTKELSGLAGHHFRPCERRLSLKGVVPPRKPEPPEQFWELKTLRLARTPKQDPTENGLLAVYPDRPALNRDLSPARWLWLAARGSRLVVAGRTLKNWKFVADEIRFYIAEKQLRFAFVLSTEEAAKPFLERRQIEEIDRDRGPALDQFRMLAEDHPESFAVHETPLLILDGVTCAKVIPPAGDAARDGRYVALQDVNAAYGIHKYALLWACTCGRDDEKGTERCITHGLLRRTRLLFEPEDE